MSGACSEAWRPKLAVDICSGYKHNGKGVGFAHSYHFLRTAYVWHDIFIVSKSVQSCKLVSQQISSLPRSWHALDKKTRRRSCIRTCTDREVEHQTQSCTWQCHLGDEDMKQTLTQVQRSASSTEMQYSTRNTAYAYCPHTFQMMHRHTSKHLHTGGAKEISVAEDMSHPSHNSGPSFHGQ